MSRLESVWALGTEDDITAREISSLPGTRRMRHLLTLMVLTWGREQGAFSTSEMSKGRVQKVSDAGAPGKRRQHQIPRSQTIIGVNLILNVHLAARIKTQHIFVSHSALALSSSWVTLPSIWVRV